MSSSQAHCVICGNQAAWVESEKLPLRENHACSRCKSSLRHRNQAAAIINFFGRGVFATLRDLCGDAEFSSAAVYEIGLVGPFRKYFSKWKQYTQGIHLPDVAPGQVRQGIRCEDLTRLSFDDEAFDLVISSEVMDQIFDYQAAFAELNRVLKPGGYHIFTVPLTWPLPQATVRRSTFERGKVEHHEKPRFRPGQGGAPSLVCTEFGRDLPQILSTLGYTSWFHRASVSEAPLYRDAVVVARKTGSASGTVKEGKKSRVR